jgi:DNA replication protein DnaC
MKVRFITAAALLHEMIEAADERHLQRLQKLLASQDLLIIDELGFVPLSKTGAELLFEVISQRYERSSIIITSNLPFDEWTEVFGSERLPASQKSASHSIQSNIKRFQVGGQVGGCKYIFY